MTNQFCVKKLDSLLAPTIADDCNEILALTQSKWGAIASFFATVGTVGVYGLYMGGCFIYTM